MTIRINYSNMMGDSVGGIPESEWASAPAHFEKAFAGFEQLRKAGTAGFADMMQLLGDRAFGRAVASCRATYE